MPAPQRKLILGGVVSHVNLKDFLAVKSAWRKIDISRYL